MAKADPRHRNAPFDTSSIATYLNGYGKQLEAALAAIDTDMLDRARAVIEAAAVTGRRVFSAGNGGSAAIADHLCCDFTKGTHAPGHPIIDSCSLTANAPLNSALANYFGFEVALARNIELVGREGDVLLAISSSGNSPNILNAVDAARARGMATIGLSGFDGGRLKDAVDISIHVDAANYGIVEDAHQSLTHVIAQYIACHRDATLPA